MSRWLLLLAGLLGALLLLGPTADRAELRAQLAARVLSDDATGGRELFGALAEHAAPERRFEIHAEPRIEAVFATALNVYNANAAAPLERVRPGAGGAPATRLDLTLSEVGAHVTLDALIARGGREPRRVRLQGVLPARWALLAPLVAIVVALAFRLTLLALYGGVLVGAIWLRVEGGADALTALFGGIADLPLRYFWRELTDSFRLELIGFTFALISMVGVMIRGAGVQGFIELLLRFAASARSTLAVSFGMGLSIFFDDYSNCLIVGNTMRPLTDRLRVSREKLAYVVDSTAAPVAGLSLLSTWVVFEVSTYSAQLPAVGITENPYAIFIQTVPFRFYCLFSLGFVLLNILTQRDFGPMLSAEKRARLTGQVVRPGGTPMLSDRMTNLVALQSMQPRARNALIPLAIVLFVTIEEIFRAGGGFALAQQAQGSMLSMSVLTEILSRGGGTAPLLAATICGWLGAAFLSGSNTTRAALAAGAGVSAIAGPLLELDRVGVAGVFVASAALASGVFVAASALASLAGVRLATRQAFLSAREIALASLASVRSLLFAIAILFGAWMIGSVCSDARTAEYLVALMSGVIDPILLPLLLFLAACLVSFATGTSWGTMAILLPNVVALAAAVGAEHDIGAHGMVVVCIGAVLEGSIFGDHCSPISDTTVLSSLATASDHMDHVRTQAPYALAVAAIAVVAGYLPTLLLPFWSFPLATATATVLGLGLLYGLGTRLPDAALSPVGAPPGRLPDVPEAD